MSEIRSVSVHLDADVAGYIAKMKLAGAETDRAFGGRTSSGISSTNSKLAATESTLGKVSTSARKADTDLTRLGSTVDSNRVKVDAGLRSIDKYSGRLGVLGDAAIALGPALITIGAEGVPALAAVGTSALFAGAGAGVMLLAFHGVGDALTKFNKASLEPTAANITAAQVAMDKLPPSARALVLELHQLGPEFQSLQRVAANGIIPGATDGLHALQSDLPVVRQGIRGISSELGTLARDAGQSLGSEEWRPFLRFVRDQAPPAIDDLGRSVGHLGHGVASLVMDFGPLTRDVDHGILNLARDFDRWASSVGRTRDFQSFLAYVEANGPRVIDLLGQTGKTFVDIATAAAPLGGPVIDILTRLLQIIDGVAQSDLGTPIFAGLLAFRTYARVAQLLGVQVETSWRGVAAAPMQVVSGIDRAKSATMSWASQTKTDLAAMAGEYERLGRVQSTALSLASGTTGASQRTRSTLATVGKGAAIAGGTALLFSGAPAKLGATNTATLALAGSIAGPLGAAIGGSVGAFIDWRSQMNASDDAIHQLQRSASSFDISGINSGLADLKSQQDAMTGGSFFKSVGAGLNITYHSIAGGSDVIDRQTQALVDAANAAAADRDVLTQLAGAYDKGKAPVDQFGRSMTLTNAQLAGVAARSAPAMQALGISVSDLQAASAAGDGSLDALVGRIVEWTNRADTAAGRGKAVSRAFADMSNDALTAEDRVTGLTTSLDALIDPMLNLGQARDAFRQGLNDLEKGLAKSNRSLRGNSDAAIQNRNAIRSQVSNLKTFVEAQAKAGVAPQKMIATLKQGRQAIIDEGHAAGLNKQQIKAMIDQMGLTPKQIRTTVQLLGAAQAQGELTAVQRAIAAIPRSVTTHVTVTRSTNANLAEQGVLTGKPKADGGTVEGARYPYGDKVLIAAAPGEEIITNRNGEADRFRADRASGRIPRYANGGTVAGASTHTTSNHPDAFMTRTRLELHHFQVALAESTKELDRERQHRQNLAQQRASLVSSVRDNFRSDFLAGTAGAWGVGSDPASILRADIANARQFTHLDARLGRRGASVGLLSQVDTLAEAQLLAGDSPAELRRLSRLYAQRQRASQAAGTFAGDSVFGERLAESNHHLRQLRGDVHRLTDQVKHLEAAEKKAHEKNAHEVGKQINGAAKTARRRGRPPS